MDQPSSALRRSDVDDASTPDPAPSGPAGGEVAPVGAQTEHAWIRAAQAGDEGAFERLVREHQARAWRIARNMVPSDEDARDLVQEAFLRVFRNLERFDFQYTFATWLHRIVTNLAIDLLRRRRPAQSTRSADDDEPDLDLVDPDAEAPSAGLEREETALEVQSVLDSLAPHFQTVLRLRELEGLPCNEIAEIVGATHVTVRWRLHRGRKLFQEEWERRRRVAERSRGSTTDVDLANSRSSSAVDPGRSRPGSQS